MDLLDAAHRTVTYDHSEHDHVHVTPEAAMALLKEGNRRFRSNERFNRCVRRQLSKTHLAQAPFAIILSCIDSRVSTQLVFDQGIGCLLDACVAGGVLNEDIIGSMEYATQYARASLVLIMGHTNCGAVAAACDNLMVGHIRHVVQKLAPAVLSTHTKSDEVRSSNNKSFVDRVAGANVVMTINEIRSRSHVLRQLEENGDIRIAGAMYDVSSGSVEFL